MAAYVFETQSDLPSQITSVSNIDTATATQIANFLALNDQFTNAGGTIKVETPSYFTGTDPTTGVGVYEIQGTQEVDYATGDTVGSPIANAIQFDASNANTLPGSGAAIVMADSGPDTINVLSNVSNSYLFATGSGNDFINLHNSTGSDTVLTGAGNDSIILGDGLETVFTGTGDDSVNVSNGTNKIYGGTDTTGADGGNDYFYVGGGNNTIVASSAGNNIINAFAGNNDIFLGIGADSVNGYSAGLSSSSDQDFIHLGSGSDTVNIGAGHWTVSGGTGTDYVYGIGGGASTIDLSLTSTTNVVQLQTGSNSLVGGNYGDVINAFGGANTIVSGGGNDSINLYNASYSSSTDTDSVTLGIGADSVITGAGTGDIKLGAGQDYVGIDNGGKWSIDGSNEGAGISDVIQATSGQNTISGGAANNTFNIFGGTNTVTGGSGTDVFDVTASGQSLVGGSHWSVFDIGTNGGSATDTIVGGSGVNEYNINATSGTISISGSNSPSQLDFTQLTASQETDPGHSPVTNLDGSQTYTFGTGLSLTISNPTHTTVKFG